MNTRYAIWQAAAPKLALSLAWGSKQSGGKGLFRRWPGHICWSDAAGHDPEKPTYCHRILGHRRHPFKCFGRRHREAGKICRHLVHRPRPKVPRRSVLRESRIEIVRGLFGDWGMVRN